MTLLLLAVCTFAASVALTWWIRRYALRRELLDHPNDRSSHAVPTPRGGGGAIALSYLLGLTVLFGLGRVAWPLLAALLGGGFLVAVVGFWDDHGHVKRRIRFGAHILAAAWAVWWLGGMESIRLAGSVLDLGLLGGAVALLGVVYLLNIYNFMDGIDGIAGGEAVTVALVGGGVLAHFALPELAWPLWLLAAATGGFLVFNWPPATIFMGDVGSGFLGFVFGVFVVALADTPAGFWPLLILLGVFIVDASVTLGRRVLRRERFYDAHRSHAYQHAARLRGHLVVSATVCLVNVLLLGPAAYLAGEYPGWNVALFAFCALVLGAGAYRLGAGRACRDA